MKVTIHEGLSSRSCEGTRNNVYALKIELDGRTDYPEGERIEVAHGGAFYRIEPDGPNLTISIVGVSVKRLVVCPQSANAITIRGLRQIEDSVEQE
jgi:hypothetical protein